MSNNLIDFEAPPPAPHPTHNYVNDYLVGGSKNNRCPPRDVFDMRMLLS